MGESFCTGLHQIRSSFSKEGTSGRREAHATGHEKRHGRSSQGAENSFWNNICPESCNACDPTDRIPPERSDTEKTCRAEAFALENERVPDVGQLPHVEGLISSVWTTNRGGSSHATPNQRSVFGFRPLKDRIIRKADGEEITVRGVGKVNLVFHSGRKAVPVTLDD